MLLNLCWSNYLPKKSCTKVFLNCFFLSQSVVLQMLNLTSWLLCAERKIHKTLSRYICVSPDPSSLLVAVASPLTFESASSFSFKNHFSEKKFCRIFQTITCCFIQKHALTLSLGDLTGHSVCAMTEWIMDSEKLCTNMRLPLKLVFYLFSL